MSVDTCGNMISQLKRFLDWLHTSRFSWRKPQDYPEIKTSISKEAIEVQASLEQVKTFTLRELVLLNKYATPIERAWLLLGLNCGFGMAEIASMLVKEACLFEAHEDRYQEYLAYRTTNSDSFIKRVRRKNKIYGEHILFPQTVQAIQWATARRSTQPNFTPDSILFLNDEFHPYDKQTKSGNRNQQIPNAFARLLKRVEKGGNEISRLSFGKLRKTSGDLVRRFSTGEIASVFLCHRKTVGSDSLVKHYTNRPLGKVFEAIRKVEEFLAPVFEAAGENPFEIEE